MTKDEALKLALPLLEDCVNSYRLKYERPAFAKAIAAIKEALAQPEQWGSSAVTQPEYVAEQKRKTAELRSMLAQPEQEPVAWVSEDVCKGQYIDGRPRKIWWECEKGVGTAFYTTPPQRTWVGLAVEDRLCAKYMQDAPDGIEAVIDYIEAKLKELNT